MNKIVGFLKEVKLELEKVSWPKREEVINYLVLVVIISVIVSGFVGLVDFSLTKSLEKLLIK